VSSGAARRGRGLVRAIGGLLAALLAAAALAGCPAAHGDYPTTACSGPSDCFVGEACVAGSCVPAAQEGGDDGGDGGAGGDGG
jgi:hypothetical protein